VAQADHGNERGICGWRDWQAHTARLYAAIWPAQHRFAGDVLAFLMPTAAPLIARIADE
jgi:hypothetical protein